MSSRTSRTFVIALAALAIVLVAGLAWLAFRPGAHATSRRNPQIVIDCSGATGASAATCQAWGDAILAADPAPPTFERADLRRVTIDRSLLGFGSCSAAFFILRYPDAPAWSGEVPCR